MIRCRFRANPDDYRPVTWPVKHPYWCTGSAGDGSYSIVVAYADNEKQIKELWPEATHLDSTEVDSYTFTDRFQKPEWFVRAEQRSISQSPWTLGCIDSATPILAVKAPIGERYILSNYSPPETSHEMPGLYYSMGGALLTVVDRDSPLPMMYLGHLTIVGAQEIVADGPGRYLVTVDPDCGDFTDGTD